jgi:hypothetical protein
MEKVLLNGEFVSAESINSAKHKFIGTFRTPLPPASTSVWLCDCGACLWTKEGIFIHWQQGHMDMPQYVDIINEFKTN